MTIRMRAVAKGLVRWEFLLIILIVVAGAWSASLSPYYLSAYQILYSLRLIVIAGLLGLGLMPIVVLGEIDISLPSILAVGTILLAQFAQHSVPIWIAVPAVVLVGACAGAFNGFLITAFGLPSLAVTLGTMGAYRAVAFLVGGQNGYIITDNAYIGLGSNLIAKLVPFSLCLFALAILVFACVMHGTVFGRLAYAVGNNAAAARYSGIRVPLVKIAAFALGGAMAALAAWVYVGQYESARADNASDILLFIVTAVVLGGIDIFGGRGNVLGLALSLLLLGTLNNGMGLANIPGQVQTIVIGALLIVSVLIPQLSARRRVPRVLRWLPRGLQVRMGQEV